MRLGTRSEFFFVFCAGIACIKIVYYSCVNAGAGGDENGLAYC